MKRGTQFRILFVLALSVLFTGGVFAQTHAGTTIPGAAADYSSGAVDGTTYITAGTTVPVYALPDSYLHPDYDVAAGDYTLVDGFTWTWSVTAGTATDLTFSQNGAQDNYVAVTAIATASGAYTISVVEAAPAAYGGCSGAATTLDITVVAAPQITIDGGDATYDFCEGAAGLPTDIQTTITGGWEAYHVVWTLEIKTLNNGGADEFWYSDETGAGQAGAAFNAVNYTTGSPQTIATAAAAPDLMTVTSFDVINNGTRDATTVYTYTLTSINDRASRFGNFIALNGSTADQSLFTYYATPAASDVVTVTIHPAPVTGPIYHIQDGWAN